MSICCSSTTPRFAYSAKADNLLTAGRLIRGLGPKAVVVKKGEHGCLLFDAMTALLAYAAKWRSTRPASGRHSFPDSLSGDLGTQQKLRASAAVSRGLCYGIVITTLTVEGYGLDRLRTATRAELTKYIPGI